MATKEEVGLAIQLIEERKPLKVFEEMHRKDMGVYAVIKYLDRTAGEVKAVDICKFLGISSARMAVVLKKLETKNLVTKGDSSIDARAKTIKLTEKGKVLAKDLKEQMYYSVEKIVDEFGLEEFQQLMQNIHKLDKILVETRPNEMEVFHD